MTTPVASTSDPQQGDLNAKIFQRLHPRIYLERFIAESVRPDGRTFDDWRDLSVNVGAFLSLALRPFANCDRFILYTCYSISLGSIGTANGSSLVRLGDTTIVCGVKAEIAEPDLDRPDEGWIGLCSLWRSSLSRPPAYIIGRLRTAQRPPHTFTEFLQVY